MKIDISNYGIIESARPTKCHTRDKAENFEGLKKEIRDIIVND